MKQAKKSHPFKGNTTYVFFLLAVLAGIYLVMTQTIFAKKIHSEQVQQVYGQELSGLNLLLTSYGFKANAATKGLACSNLDGDQVVRLNCRVGEERQRQADAVFIDRWRQTYSKELAYHLDGEGWVKEPNLDPVTKNPVNALDRLFEYKGVYAADVSYVKKRGNVDCWFRVYVAEKGSAINPIISLKDGCSSIIKN